MITSQEIDDTKKYIFKIKGEGISEAIHTYLLTQCYSYSWDNRFYKDEINFDMKKKTGVKDVDAMLVSINKIITDDKIINGSITYSGSICSKMPKEGMRVVKIKVRILYDSPLLPMDKRKICIHDYYDLYKRDLLDSLGEKIGIFYDYDKDSQTEDAVPGVVLASFKKGVASGESIGKAEQQYTQKAASASFDPKVNPIPNRSRVWYDWD
ncbi:MAG TPA: hypothetical protein PKK26_13650 [Candidatus Wallbacteria bacterium]|mgnify:CR=1 FL=1|nr:hypothetical protein [Candidatus Wallbacteria bacterium]